MKTSYVAMATDVYHSGHINVINEASKYGEVTVGVLTDEVVATYKRPPFLDTEERMKIATGLKGVSRVVVQKSMEYTDILNELKPNYVIHGDDWRTGPLQKVREKVIETLKEWDGELVEVPYTKHLSTEKLSRQLSSAFTTPDKRLSKLKKLLRLKPYVRAIDASNGLTGLIAENVRVADGGTVKEFDAINFKRHLTNCKPVAFVVKKGALVSEKEKQLMVPHIRPTHKRPHKLSKKHPKKTTLHSQEKQP